MRDTLTPEKPEIITNPPNKRMFPNALPSTNERMDTTPVHNRVSIDWNNDTVAAAIAAGSKRREESEVFVDRREPVTLRRTLESIQNGASVLRGQAATVAATIVEIEKAIGTLKKLEKQSRKLKSNPYSIGTLKQLQERLSTEEEKLARLRQKERRIALDLKNNEQARKDFLASRPRKDFPTNGEMLTSFDEARSLQEELRRLDHLASSKAGMFI